MKNSKKKLIILLVGLLLLTGCTKTLTDENNKAVKNEETGKALTENVLCRPTDETTIKLYEEILSNPSKLDSVIKDDLRKIKKEYNVTIILIEHDFLL